jgi:hypothetical protein
VADIFLGGAKKTKRRDHCVMSSTASLFTFFGCRIVAYQSRGASDKEIVTRSGSVPDKKRLTAKVASVIIIARDL